MNSFRIISRKLVLTPYFMVFVAGPVLADDPDVKRLEQAAQETFGESLTKLRSKIMLRSDRRASAMSVDRLGRLPRFAHEIFSEKISPQVVGEELLPAIIYASNDPDSSVRVAGRNAFASILQSEGVEPARRFLVTASEPVSSARASGFHLLGADRVAMIMRTYLSAKILFGEADGIRFLESAPDKVSEFLLAAYQDRDRLQDRQNFRRSILVFAGRLPEKIRPHLLAAIEDTMRNSSSASEKLVAMITLAEWDGEKLNESDIETLVQNIQLESIKVPSDEIVAKLKQLKGSFSSSRGMRLDAGVTENCLGLIRSIKARAQSPQLYEFKRALLRMSGT